MYHFKCICGEAIQTGANEGMCSACGRAYTVKWQADYEPTPDPKVIDGKLCDTPR